MLDDMVVDEIKRREAKKKGEWEPVPLEIPLPLPMDEELEEEAEEVPMGDPAVKNEQKQDDDDPLCPQRGVVIIEVDPDSQEPDDSSSG